MSLVIKQISALEKVRLHDELNHKETNAYTVLQGQRLSYQVAIDATHLKWQTNLLMQSTQTATTSSSSTSQTVTW